MPALCPTHRAGVSPLTIQPGSLARMGGDSSCCVPSPQTLKRRGVGLDGPELEPDEGPEGPGEKLRRLAGDGGEPALPRPRLYVSDSLPCRECAPPPPLRPKWSRPRLEKGQEA